MIIDNELIIGGILKIKQNDTNNFNIISMLFSNGIILQFNNLYL